MPPALRYADAAMLRADVFLLARLIFRWPRRRYAADADYDVLLLMLLCLRLPRVADASFLMFMLF